MSKEEMIKEIKLRCRKLIDAHGVIEHHGNGYFVKCYEETKVRIELHGGIDEYGKEVGDLSDHKPLELMVDYGELMVIEEDFDDDKYHRVTDDAGLIEKVLEDLRQHMVLDDLADV